jgi:hypothetical protein
MRDHGCQRLNDRKVVDTRGHLGRGTSTSVFRGPPADLSKRGLASGQAVQHST